MEVIFNPIPFCCVMVTDDPFTFGFVLSPLIISPEEELEPLL